MKHAAALAAIVGITAGAAVAAVAAVPPMAPREANALNACDILNFPCDIQDLFKNPPNPDGPPNSDRPPTPPRPSRWKTRPPPPRPEKREPKIKIPGQKRETTLYMRPYTPRVDLKGPDGTGTAGREKRAEGANEHDGD